MKHQIPHDLTQDLARRATDMAFESYKERFEKYNPESSWVNDTTSNIKFSAKGITMTGVVELLPTAIELELKVPFLFRVFQKTAVEIIEREIKKWIEKARNGELDE